MAIFLNHLYIQRYHLFLVLFDCSFENAMCGLLNDPSAALPWQRSSGGTQSSNTGPSEGDNQSQFYVFVEATNVQVGDKAR